MIAMNNDNSQGTVRFNPHNQPAGAGTQKFDPHANSAFDADATHFDDQQPTGIGTQKFDPNRHNAGMQTQQMPQPQNNAPGNPLSASGSRLQHSSARKIARKIPWGPVWVTVIGMIVISVAALFFLFDDVWYNLM